MPRLSRAVHAITPSRAFTGVWCTCAALGAALFVVGLLSEPVYGASAFAFLAVIWGPLLAALAAGCAAGIHRLAHR